MLWIDGPSHWRNRPIQWKAEETRRDSPPGASRDRRGFPMADEGAEGERTGGKGGKVEGEATVGGWLDKERKKVGDKDEIN